jgi:hypothetical protein
MGCVHRAGQSDWNSGNRRAGLERRKNKEKEEIDGQVMICWTAVAHLRNPQVRPKFLRKEEIYFRNFGEEIRFVAA